MNFIQSLFIQPSQNPLTDSFGWYAPIYHLMSWALSCLSIKERTGYIKLYTNSKGRDLLINQLGLPYDEVILSMEGWNLPHPKLWALSKIHTYSQQKEPFLHIDGDVYLFDEFPQRIYQGKVVAQNVEEFTDYYYSFMRPINRAFTYFPECLTQDFMEMERLHALNAGILGGNDIDFFKDYTSEAFKYVESNIQNLKNLDADRFNVFFEQHLCYKLAEGKNIKIEYLLPQSYHDNSYLGLDRFQDILNGKCSYIHLLGNYKADEFTCRQMAKCLRYFYPEYYDRIVSYFASNASTTCLGKWDKNFIPKSGKYSFVWDPVVLNDNLRGDFLDFKGSIETFIRDNLTIFDYSHKNDFARRQLIQRWAHRWHHDIIDLKKSFTTNDAIKVFVTRYNWPRYYRATKSSGIKYYANAVMETPQPGEYYTLLIPGNEAKTPCVYDIDEFEAVIIEEVKEHNTLQDLEKSMTKYLANPTSESDCKKLKELIHESLSRLILMEAIRPL